MRSQSCLRLRQLLWRGSPCNVDAAIRRGVVSVPHGFGAPNVNALTSTTHDVDPLTGMVLLSGLPVALSPA